MRLGLIIASILGCIVIGFNYFTSYRSAFEADQECHYQMNITFASFNDMGCDHDLETRQWILFRSNEDLKPSEVVARFRY